MDFVYGYRWIILAVDFLPFVHASAILFSGLVYICYLDLPILLKLITTLFFLMEWLDLPYYMLEVLEW